MFCRSSKRNRRNCRHRLQIAAPLTLAPAKRNGRAPVDLRRSRRQHAFNARKNRFGARQELFEFVHDGPVDLRAVVGVDAHVIVRQIARPDRGLRVAAAEQRRESRSRFSSSRAGRLPRGIPDCVRRLSPPARRRGTDRSCRHRGRHARVADRRKNAAEVRIGCVERRLHERRMADRIRDLAAFGDARAAFHRAPS